MYKRHLSYKERRPFDLRQQDVQNIRRIHPTKIPAIIEKFHGEKQLPNLERTKYLIPGHTTVGELVKMIRLKLQLHSNQTFFLLINQRSMACISMTIAELYDREKDVDGFLYIVYASQEFFGGEASCPSLQFKPEGI